MGCGGSNALPPPPPLVIPDVAGWDGKEFRTRMASCEIPFTGNFFNVSASMEPLKQVIEGNAAEGFKLMAVFLPISMVGKSEGEPLDGKWGVDFSAGAGYGFVRATCIFQADPHEPALPMETLLLNAPIALDKAFYGREQSAKGYEGLYGQLAAAGAQGFPLCYIIDEPAARMNKALSSESNVLLICQRRQGIASLKQYQVTNCPIKMESGKGWALAASMTGLPDVLQQFVSSGYKVANIYNPPTRSKTEAYKYETACHIVFEKAHCNYITSVVDCDYRFTSGIGAKTIDHSQYYNVIEKYTSKGWELAGLIDMPNEVCDGRWVVGSTIKLVFQAAASQSAPVSNSAV